jgi:hypothetical protein
MLSRIDTFSVPLATDTFADVQIPKGISTNSTGTVFIAHDSLQGQRIQSYNPFTYQAGPATITIPGTLPGSLLTLTSDMAAHLPASNLPGGVQGDDLLNLLPNGQIGVWRPSTGHSGLLVGLKTELISNSRGLPIFNLVNTDIFDAYTDQTSNFGGTIIPEFASYESGDLAVFAGEGFTDIFISGQASALPFIMRLRYVDGERTDAGVVASSSGQTQGSVLPPGVGVNERGIVLTTLPVRDAVFNPEFAVNVPIAFDVGYLDGDGRDPFRPFPLLSNPLALQTSGRLRASDITVDSFDNFIIATTAESALSGYFLVTSNLGHLMYQPGISDWSLSLQEHGIAISPNNAEVYLTTSLAGSQNFTHRVLLTLFPFMPDATWTTPSGWDGPIVVSTQPGTSSNDTTITTADNVHVDFAVRNRPHSLESDLYRTRSAFQIKLTLNGEPVVTETVAESLGPGDIFSVRDVNLGQLPAGEHTLELQIDALDEQPELDEQNNVLVKQITVVSPNAPPTISEIARQAIAVGRSTATLPFTVGDDTTPPQSLIVIAVTDNLTLIPLSGIALGGSGEDRTIRITPAPGQLGTATIAIGVHDGSLSTQRRFTVEVFQPPADLRGKFLAMGFDTSNANQQLFEIDAASGTVTRIGPSGTGISGLAITSDGALLGINGSTNQFFSVNRTTGAATLIAELTPGVTGGLAHDVATDSIYSIEDGNSALVRIGRSGDVHRVGPGIPGLDVASAIAFDQANNRVIAFDLFGRELYGINPITGHSELLTTTTDNHWGLAYGAGRLVAEGGYTSTFTDYLLAIDPTSGSEQPIQQLSQRLAIAALEFVVASTGLGGDYNDNGTVDAADYVVWRNNRGNTGPPGIVGDGSGPITGIPDGVVDQRDHDYWKANFDKRTPAPSASGGLAAAAQSAVARSELGSQRTLARSFPPEDFVVAFNRFDESSVDAMRERHRRAAPAVDGLFGDDLLLLAAARDVAMTRLTRSAGGLRHDAMLVLASPDEPMSHTIDEAWADLLRLPAIRWAG